MTERLRILLVEDLASDAELEMLELERAGLSVTHSIVDNKKSFVDALREFEPDVILSDFSMPGFDGTTAVALSREMRPDTPFIFVSGTIGEESAIDALKSGATDYVMKTNLVRLPGAVTRALRDGKARVGRSQTEKYHCSAAAKKCYAESTVSTCACPAVIRCLVMPAASHWEPDSSAWHGWAW